MAEDGQRTCHHRHPRGSVRAPIGFGSRRTPLFYTVLYLLNAHTKNQKRLRSDVCRILQRIPKESNRKKHSFYLYMIAVSYTHLTLPTICSV